MGRTAYPNVGLLGSGTRTVGPKNSTPRLVRLYLVMSLLAVLPFAEVMWSMPGHPAYALLLALISLVLAVSIREYRATERETKALQLRLRQNAGDFDKWKEKMRELGRIVALLSEENASYRHPILDARLHETSQGTGAPP